MKVLPSQSAQVFTIGSGAVEISLSRTSPGPFKFECLRAVTTLGRWLGLETSCVYTFSLSHALPFVSSLDCMIFDPKSIYTSVSTELSDKWTAELNKGGLLGVCCYSTS